MSNRNRNLTVLGEFKPFGLIAEALDGKPVIENTIEDKYNYFLFDPKITRERNQNPDDYDSSASASCDRSDHELFVRGNRIIWSSGSRVQKRYTSPSSVIMSLESFCEICDSPHGEKYFRSLNDGVKIKRSIDRLYDV